MSTSVSKTASSVRDKSGLRMPWRADQDEAKKRDQAEAVLVDHLNLAKKQEKRLAMKREQLKTKSM